ncbi:MAG: hypothetical protein KAS04_03825 [Candidatus Aenigmarchaeota archaeon]|nr:hypothetical protein [Candidatus Aenigmarchaeota archaeon]
MVYKFTLVCEGNVSGVDKPIKYEIVDFYKMVHGRKDIPIDNNIISNFRESEGICFRDE